MGEMLSHIAAALLNVGVVGLVLGAGVPSIFALGMRALGMGRTVAADGESYTTPVTTSGRVVSSVCFALAGVAVVFGIIVIIWGKQIFG